MKKIIIILLCINAFFYIQTIPTHLEKIDLNLRKNELGVIFINLDNSKSILFSLNDESILYILECTNYDELSKYLNFFNFNVYHIISNSNYNIENIKTFEHFMRLNNIIFHKEDYLMISYADKTLCINPKLNNCDYVYYTENIPFNINDNTKVFLYNDNIDVSSVYNKWIDSYKVSKNIYTILKIKDNYEVLQIPKNI